MTDEQLLFEVWEVLEPWQKGKVLSQKIEDGVNMDEFIMRVTIADILEIVAHHCCKDKARKVLITQVVTWLDEFSESEYCVSSVSKKLAELLEKNYADRDMVQYLAEDLEQELRLNSDIW